MDDTGAGRYTAAGIRLKRQVSGLGAQVSGYWILNLAKKCIRGAGCGLRGTYYSTIGISHPASSIEYPEAKSLKP